MPYYKALYKTDADDDYRQWPLGALRDKYSALAAFNAEARDDLGKEFEFHEGPPRDEPPPGDYVLGEREQLNRDSPVLFAIYECKQIGSPEARRKAPPERG